ncbi:hypothetical protein EDB85DRAFT_1960768 [Lactarius pseudohatsudake]|nr:hypothetical protein EDB85DRAFT_1960768 [Lactarius pseudohatsudake]
MISERSHDCQGTTYQETLQDTENQARHPIWLATTECEKDGRGKKTKKALFSRRTTSTALQIAVDHAFTGSYSTRFRPTDPPESRRCPCGEPLRTSVHTLYRCQRYYFETFGVVKYGRIIPYDKLLSSHKKNALRFLTFLQETRALSSASPGPNLAQTRTCHPNRTEGGTQPNLSRNSRRLTPLAGVNPSRINANE